MAYSGWNLKIGDYIVPEDKFIKADSYSAYINSQDLDSYVDANGELQRAVLDHYRIKVEFETPAMLTDITFEELMSNIRRNYVVAKERKVLATVYIPELGDYVTQYCYISDPKPTIYGTYGGRIHYNAVRFALIGY